MNLRKKLMIEERDLWNSQKMFLMNVDYYLDPIDQIPIIRFFGKTPEGEFVIVSERNFRPYFYVANPSRYDERMIKSGGARIVENVDLELYQETISCVKVETRTPTQVPKLRDRLERKGRQVFSADILFQLRYLYDMDVGAFVNVYYDEHGIQEVERIEPFEPKLNVLTFDIECSLRSREVYCIAAQVNDRDGVIFTDKNGEKAMIEEFVEFVHDVDPDIITGYNIYGFDIPFLMECAERNDTQLAIGRQGEIPWAREDHKRNFKTWLVTGRIFVDTWQQVKQELKPIQESLGFVGELLGVGSKDNVDVSRIEDEWKNRRSVVMKYCKQDVAVTYNVFNHEKVASLKKALALSRASDLPLEHCFAPVTSRIVDSLLIRRFDKAGFAVPQNNWGAKAKPIKGAHVFEVENPGIYSNVGIFDFKSMYPSVMIKNNICPTSYTKDETDECVRSPLGAFFKQDKKGIVPTVLKELWQWRDTTRKKVENVGDYYDRLQSSIKVIMNSFYGVMASDFYRFTNPLIGGSITAFSREGIKTAYAELEKRGLNVIYGDTDSVFVHLNTKENPLNIATELSAEGMEMECEKILKTFFTHGAKKRYAALVEWPKEEFYVKGYEMKRGDSFKLQREILERVLRTILNNAPDDALMYASTKIREIKEGELDLEDLIITKNVKAPQHYVNPESMAGVQAATKLKARGYPWLAGTKVSWIVTNSSETPMEVEPYIENADYDIRPDRDYYAKRIVNTLSDIANVFDWDDMGLRSGTKQLKLF